MLESMKAVGEQRQIWAETGELKQGWSYWTVEPHVRKIATMSDSERKSLV